MRSRWVDSDPDRARVRAFFAANLNDPSGLEVTSRADDERYRIPAIIRAVEAKPGRIVGAAYASNNPADAIAWAGRGMWAEARVIAAEMLMIHKLAVESPKRRRGVGAGLMREAVQAGAAAGASVATLTFDDDVPGLSDFYAAAGFTILGGAETLALRFNAAGAPFGFPQTELNYRWACRILDPARAGLARLPQGPS